MIILQWSWPGDVVQGRKWVFHRWQLISAVINGATYYAPPRCYVQPCFPVDKAWAVRILGLEIAVLHQSKFGNQLHIGEVRA